MSDRNAKIILFLAAATIKVDINLGGRLALGEIFMLAVLPFSIFSVSSLKEERELWIILRLIILWLVGSLFADIINGNSVEYLMKGISRPIICMGILVSCYHLSYQNPRNLYYFFLGLLISGIWNYIHPLDIRAGGEAAVGSYQYYAYVYTPLFLALGSVAGYLLYYRSIVTASLIYIILGLVAFPILSRTTAAVLIISGLLLYIANKTTLTQDLANQEVGLQKIVGALIIIYCLAFYPYVYCAGHGYLGERQQQKFEMQYNRSHLVQNPLGFLFSGRVETVGAAVRVLRNPIIGNGSWPRRGDSNLIAAKLVGVDDENMSPKTYDATVRDPGHSVLFGIWSQAGILCLPFLLFAFVYSLKLFKNIFAGNDGDIVLIIPYLLIFIFSFIFNNFSSTFRFELIIFPLLYYYYSTDRLQ